MEAKSVAVSEGDRGTPEPVRRLKTATLRRIARLRKRFGWTFAFAPLGFVLAMDFVIRAHRLVSMPPKYMGSYAAAAVESALLWGALLWAASARKGIARWVASPVFAVLLTLALGVQHYFHEQYATYMNIDATLFGTDVAGSALGQLSADGKHFAVAMLVPLALSIGLVVVGRKVIRPGRRSAQVARVLSVPVVAAAFVIPCSYQRVQASTPDVIYFHAMGGLIKALTGERTAASIKPGLRHPPTLPHLTASPSIPRNVVFVLTESVRADAHCSAHVDECPNAPRVNAAAPDRMPLFQLRSNDSATAISLAVLWSGLQPIESREHLHGAPLIYDYAHAAGLENAYWTSHHMMFANSRLWVQDLPTTFQCGATDVDPVADMDTGGADELLVARAEEQMPQLKEPFLAVVHVGNTHVPYRVDPNDMPFKPASSTKDPALVDEYHNYYRDAVYMQDKTLGDLVNFIHASSFGPRTVIIFTSDHGEAFREHNQIGHTGSIFDEEIHVPGWIDAPPGTLTDSERAQIAARKDMPVFHTDITPTILDLLGLWDAPELASYKKAMPGESWLRPSSPNRDQTALAMTNCAGVWGCAYKNWGMMRGLLKLEGRQSDDVWQCFDLKADPLEQHNLGAEGCGDLPALAKIAHGGFPGGS